MCEASFALTMPWTGGNTVASVSGIGVVLNPKSRQNLRDPKAASRLARRLGDVGVVREARSIDELYRIAEDFRRDDIDVLAISGGDGTNHVTITGFLDVYDGMALPHLAFLRGGTMNTVANSVGVVHGRPDGLLSRLLRIYAQRSIMPLENVERHVMRIVPVACRSTDKAHYGFLFGTGVVAGYLSEYYRDGQPTPLVAAQTLARAIGSAFVGGEMIKRMAKPFRGTVSFDDGRSFDERDYLAIAAGTIAHIGLNFKPFHRYDEQPGCFHVLGIHASPVAFVRELPRIHRCEPMRPGLAHDALAARMVVRSPERFIKYMIDGALHESDGDLEVTVGPRVRLDVVR